MVIKFNHHRSSLPVHSIPSFWERGVFTRREWPSLSRFLRRLGVFIRWSEGRWPIQALFDLEWGIPSSNGWSEHLRYDNLQSTDAQFTSYISAQTIKYIHYVP